MGRVVGCVLLLALGGCGANLAGLGAGMAGAGAAMQGGAAAAGYSPGYQVQSYSFAGSRPVTCVTVGPQTYCH